ncbi:MAG: glycine--tRNA ligase [Planctomycetes bacterium]|nr:glycine--tRNA ligase [Planctomycetota bacterium]
MANDTDLMEKIVALAKRRGFIFPSSEIYGGINGFWDYGPLGVELKRNIKDAWWHDVVRCPPAGPDGRPIEMVGLDCSIIMNPKVWEASGHLSGFTDPMRKCPGCGHFVRADHLWDELATASVWVDSLLQEFTVVTGEIDTPRLLKWARGKGKRVAPNLALVRNPEVTLSWLATRVNGQPDAPPDLTELTRYVATEQLHQTGLQEPCPRCGAPLDEPSQVRLMFESWAGIVQDESHKVYLRPETAQGIFCNFKNVLDTQRLKMPFGIAQLGKAFRNEINPRNYTFRSREFEQMEIEFFCHPDEADAWYTYWRDARYRWYVEHGLKSDRLRLRDHAEDELAHYARSCADIEYAFPFGVSELEGVANRTDFDLKAHETHSGRDMTYFDEEAWQRDAQNFTPEHFGGDKKAAKEAADNAKKGMPYRFTPYVIEPSGGVDRAALAFLCEAYDEDEAPDEKGNPQGRTVLRFHPRLAPVKVAIFPLVKKDGMPEKAHAIYEACREHMSAFYDEKSAVGRRYRRQDEAGTPFCVTVDGQTNEDGTVTVRDRDTMEQVRVPSEGVVTWLRDRLGRV